MRRAWIALLLAATAPHAAAEICYSDSRDALVAAPPTSATPFNCPLAGRRTLAELAAAGFRVVKLTNVIVGQSGPSILAADQLVIELPRRIFNSGFEGE